MTQLILYLTTGKNDLPFFEIVILDNIEIIL